MHGCFSVLHLALRAHRQVKVGHRNVADRACATATYCGDRCVLRIQGDFLIPVLLRLQLLLIFHFLRLGSGLLWRLYDHGHGRPGHVIAEFAADHAPTGGESCETT